MLRNGKRVAERYLAFFILLCRTEVLSLYCGRWGTDDWSVIRLGTFILRNRLFALSLQYNNKTRHTYEKDFLHRNDYRNFRSYTLQCMFRLFKH
jgi:hypothetical protein